jgi:hypothetical protein
LDRLGAENSFSENRRIFNPIFRKGRERKRGDLARFLQLFAVVQDTNPSARNLQVTSPQVFTSGAIFVIAGCGVLLAAPVMLSILAVTTIKLGILTLLLPLVTLGVTAYFLPFGLGNSVVRRLVRSLSPGAEEITDGFIVQMTLAPRIRSGLRALIEDADDLGYLRFTDSELIFQGDSVKFRIPWNQITEVRPQNIGWRGRFVYGSRIWISVSGISNFQAVAFSERSSLLLPTSKRITKSLRERIYAGRERALSSAKAPVDA